MTTTAKIIVPTAFTPAMLVSTNAVEQYPTWAAGTTYAKDAFVDFGTHIYQSLVNNNTGNNPATSPTFWVLIGPDNIHAMFDGQVSTQTVSPAPLNVTVATGNIGAVYLGNLVGSRVTLTVRDGNGGPIVYQQTQSLSGEEVGDWYQYFFFDPLTQRTQALFTGIPPFASSHVTVSLQGGGSVSIGIMQFGRLRELGMIEYGAQGGFIDYSRKLTDEFGTTTFVRGAYSKRLTVNMELDRLQFNRVNRLMAEVLSTPVVFIGCDATPEYEEVLTVFGFIKSFQPTIAYPSFSLCSLEIEGLI